MLKLLAAIALLMSLSLNSSGILATTPQQIDVELYERLFQSLGERKVLERLENGGQILITRIWVGAKVKRPKLVAQYTDRAGKESKMDVLWLQPSLVYFMNSDQVLLKWHHTHLFAFGLSDAAIQKEL